jgi:hypothetical protein
MTVCMYRDIHTLQLYIIDLTQRGCHTLRFSASSWLILINKYIEMHGQQSIKIFYSCLHSAVLPIV